MASYNARMTRLVRYSPQAKKANQNLTLPKSALPFNILPEEVQELMQQCFEKNLLRQQKCRPTAENWVIALHKAVIVGFVVFAFISTYKSEK